MNWIIDNWSKVNLWLFGPNMASWGYVTLFQIFVTFRTGWFSQLGYFPIYWTTELCKCSNTFVALFLPMGELCLISHLLHEFSYFLSFYLFYKITVTEINREDSTAPHQIKNTTIEIE